jgi:hypothetical protein
MVRDYSTVSLTVFSSPAAIASLGAEPGIYFPGRSTEGILPLAPFFDGFVFISEFALNQKRDLTSSHR